MRKHHVKSRCFLNALTFKLILSSASHIMPVTLHQKIPFVSLLTWHYNCFVLSTVKELAGSEFFWRAVTAFLLMCFTVIRCSRRFANSTIRARASICVCPFSSSTSESRRVVRCVKLWSEGAKPDIMWEQVIVIQCLKMARDVRHSSGPINQAWSHVTQTDRNASKFLEAFTPSC